jgi:hypothetical protein
MKISITGQENGDLLIQAIAGAGLTVDQIYRLTVVLKVETAEVTLILDIIDQSDIVSINEVTLILDIIDQSDIVSINEVTLILDIIILLWKTLSPFTKM